MAASAKQRFRGSPTLAFALALSSMSALASALPTGNLTAATINQTFGIVDHPGTNTSLNRRFDLPNPFHEIDYSPPQADAREKFPNPFLETAFKDPKLIEFTPKAWDWPFPVNIWKEQKWGQPPESVCIWKKFVTPDVKEPTFPGMTMVKARMGAFAADMVIVRGTSYMPTTPTDRICGGRFRKELDISCKDIGTFRCHPYPPKRPDEWGTMRISFVTGDYNCAAAHIHKAMALATNGDVKLDCLEQGIEIETPGTMPVGHEWANDHAYYIDQMFQKAYFGT